MKMATIGTRTIPLLTILLLIDYCYKYNVSFAFLDPSLQSSEVRVCMTHSQLDFLKSIMPRSWRQRRMTVTLEIDYLQTCPSWKTYVHFVNQC